MLSDYKLWGLHKTLNEANQIIDIVNKSLIAQVRRRFFWENEKTYPVVKLDPKKAEAEAEAQLPKLGYLLRRRDGQPGAQWFIDDEKKKNKDPKFNAEKAGITRCLIQSYTDEARVQRDGIRFPPGVIVNKINHRVFNYDQIQDAITAKVEKGEIDCCDALSIRIALKDKMFKMGEDIINMINFPLTLSDGQRLQHREVMATLERFYRRDMDKFLAEKRVQGCGNCGGERSSTRRINNKPQFNYSGRRF